MSALSGGQGKLGTIRLAAGFNLHLHRLEACATKDGGQCPPYMSKRPRADTQVHPYRGLSRGGS